MSTATTPTGILITDCAECGKVHPVTRRHCEVCGVASIFVSLDDRCLQHSK